MKIYQSCRIVLLWACILILTTSNLKSQITQTVTDQEWKARKGLVDTLTRRNQKINYYESKVPAYQLPDPLTMLNGEKITEPRTWMALRRKEILELFRENIYGRAPVEQPADMQFYVYDVDSSAFSGRATRKQVHVVFSQKAGDVSMDILIYLPNYTKKPVPVFLGMNFRGNQTICYDPGITVTSSWVANRYPGVIHNHATEKSRGTAASRWPVEHIMERGYGLATIYYGDVDPDFDDEFKNGVQGVFDSPGIHPGDAWGSIGAWAWGLSRAMDYLETDKDIDSQHVAVIGHSRLGKTALWAGARDTRFAMVVSNCSGCGGAALSRRKYGETVERINTSFPHWFCGNFKKFNDKENDLPVDQHMLIALIAPRPVYIASADEDLWADPRGEFLAGLYASPVYHLLGLNGLESKDMPSLNTPVENGTIGYLIRTGKHDITLYNWDRYMDFADKFMESDSPESLAFRRNAQLQIRLVKVSITYSLNFAILHDPPDR